MSTIDLLTRQIKELEERALRLRHERRVLLISSAPHQIGDIIQVRARGQEPRPAIVRRVSTDQHYPTQVSYDVNLESKNGGWQTRTYEVGRYTRYRLVTDEDFREGSEY